VRVGSGAPFRRNAATSCRVDLRVLAASSPTLVESFSINLYSLSSVGVGVAISAFCKLSCVADATSSVPLGGPSSWAISRFLPNLSRSFNSVL
jgi:hypothetical protein